MSDRQQIIEAIAAHLGEVIPDAAGAVIEEDGNLEQFAGFDSLGILEALVWLESTFAIVIPDAELVVEHFDTVAKMADYVLAHRP